MKRLLFIVLLLISISGRSQQLAKFIIIGVVHDSTDITPEYGDHESYIRFYSTGTHDINMEIVEPGKKSRTYGYVSDRFIYDTVMYDHRISAAEFTWHYRSLPDTGSGVYFVDIGTTLESGTIVLYCVIALSKKHTLFLKAYQDE